MFSPTAVCILVVAGENTAPRRAEGGPAFWANETKYWISGGPRDVKNAFDNSGSQLQALKGTDFIDHSFDEVLEGEFEAFSRAAWDIAESRFRTNDTEMKYLFHFLKNHWNNGNYFEITLTSKIFACDNCKSYIAGSLKQAKAENKTIKFTFIGNNEGVKGHTTFWI